MNRETRYFCIIISTFVVLILILSWYTNKPDLSGNSTEVSKKADYCIYIQIEDKTLYLLQDGKCIKKYPIASGASYSPSPLGCWKITVKDDWGEGFGGRWLGLNVPWGMYGIHGTIIEESIGSSASHGCIRMFNLDVQDLYKIVPVGTEVVIVEGSYGPFGSGFKDIEVGDRGADVMAIQVMLKKLGYFKGWESGIYEDDLKFALHRFQKEMGLVVKNTISKEDWLRMGFMEFE